MAVNNLKKRLRFGCVFISDTRYPKSEYSGVVNTLNYVSELTLQGKIFALLGGMRLFEASKERLEATADAFARYDVQLIGPCHCTGQEAKMYLRLRFPDRFLEC